MQHAARHCNANTCSVKKSCRLCQIYSGAASTRTDTASTISAAPPGRGAPMPPPMPMPLPMHQPHARTPPLPIGQHHAPRTRQHAPRQACRVAPRQPDRWYGQQRPTTHTATQDATRGRGGQGYAPDSGAVGLDTLAHRLLPPFRICQPELEKSLDIGVKRVVELYRCRTFWYWGDTFRSGARRLWSHALVF
jgi:hypothetical protein